MAQGKTVQNIANKLLKGTDYVDDIFKKASNDSLLRSNGAINKAYDFVMGSNKYGIKGSIHGMANNKGIINSIKDAHMIDGKGLNYKAIAGTYIGASLAGRALSGGGLYRDSTGNVNMPGVPFI